MLPKKSKRYGIFRLISRSRRVRAVLVVFKTIFVGYLVYIYWFKHPNLPLIPIIAVLVFGIVILTLLHIRDS